MAWIESHQSLREHPKCKKFCRLLRVSKPEAVGYLHMLWWWALDYAEDGSLSKYDAMDIAIGAEWEGDETEFVNALVTAGFLDRDGESLVIHDWHEYAGKLIERRARNAKRMRDARADNDAGTDEPRASHVQRTPDARVQLPTQPTNQPNPTVPNQPTEPDQPVDVPPAAKPKTQRSVKTPVPEDLVDLIPADVWSKLGKEQQLSDEQLRFETGLMIDHFRKRGERMVDWVAAWRSWIRSPYRQSKPKPPDAFELWKTPGGAAAPPDLRRVS